MKKTLKILSLLLAFVMAAACLTGCGATKTAAILKALEGDALDFDDTAGVSVHDPSLFKAENGTYYVTGSHITSAKSEDLINWQTVSAGVYDSNRTLVKDGSTLRESLAEAFAWCDGAQTLYEYSDEQWETNVWASDIIYNEAMGKYCYYACSSVWGTTSSVIWLAVSDSAEGTFEFSATVVYSGFNRRTTRLGKPKNQLHYSFTNISTLIKNGTFTTDEVEAMPWFDENGNYDCAYGKYPNAIDPAAFYDGEGKLWLVYGSYSGGVYVMPLVEETGLPDYEAMRSAGYDIYFGKQISCTNEATSGTGEGPFITYDSESGYYYLFLTYGGLDALGGYNIREYRSESPDGPYVDAARNSATDAANTGVKLIGNYQFSFDERAYLSAGHSSCFIDDDGKIYQAYHQRYNDGTGSFFNVKIHQMLKTANGWLTMLPLEYSGETAKPVTLSDLAGEYEAVLFSNDTKTTNSWDAVADIIEPTAAAVIGADGSLTIGADSGKIQLDSNTYTFSIELGGATYSGAFCTGTQGEKTVMTFSAVSDTNQTLWAVAK